MNHEENSRETALDELHENLTVCAKYRFTSQNNAVGGALHPAYDVAEHWPLDGSFVFVAGNIDELMIVHSEAGDTAIKQGFKHGSYFSLFLPRPPGYAPRREYVLYMFVPGHDDNIRQWLNKAQTAFGAQQILQPLDMFGV